MEMDNKGNFHPLQGASVIWLGTGKGVMTGNDGIFKIPADTIQRLIISYTGYESDTMSVHPADEIRVVMASGGHLKRSKGYCKTKSFLHITY